ncbi:hypothetical protein Leryth_013449 [Lithospermum erythrorhizon]|uniref:DUF4378 domain-containing protein n=1 Tax=Lithospermum erythrorhizon TaxID=34254 RepID=A0AAV3RJ22_LITER|nr:hypothetical protein Leryth_013449 [Lithospermum erythrorhizon]
MTESFLDEGIVEKRTMEEIDEQYTPVSVLTSPFQEDREFNYHYGFENNQSKVKAQKQVNETEEKARQLFHHLKGTIVANSYDSLMQDNFLMDFFWEELSTNKKDEKDELLEGKLVATAQDWLRGVQEGCYVWTEENKRENYVKEMEKGLKWTKHEEEKEEMASELEKLVLNSLVDEVLFDLITL